MKSQTKLKAKTWSLKLQSEIVALLPLSYKFKKKHIAGIGYVYFIYDALNEKIGQCFKDTKKGMVLNIL